MSDFEKKVEALKVWYSVFGVVLDTQEYTDAEKLTKLRQLRDQIDHAVGGGGKGEA